MAVVGSHDGDRIHAVGAGGFGIQHFLYAGIHAVGAIPSSLPACLDFQGRRKDAGDDLVAVIEPGRLAVHRADEGAGSAADDGQAEPASQHGITGFKAISFLLCQKSSERLNNQFVVFFLGKAGDRDRANHAGVLHDDGKTTAVWSIFAFR
jgi:hypothetical protein